MKNYVIKAEYIGPGVEANVEQVCSDGSIEWALYEPYKISYIYEKILNNINDLEIYKDDLLNKKFLGINNKICVLFKNIVFIGNKHYSDEKRIEIPGNYHKIYESNLLRGIKTLICGYYEYKGNVLIAIFDSEDYMSHGKTNQSAGWVYLSDLVEATINGFYSRIDKNNNHVHFMNLENFIKFIKSEILKKTFNLIDEETQIKNYLSKFFSQMNKKMIGLDCYKEMKMEDYSQWKQSSWEGFYPEFLLQKYLSKVPTPLITWWGKKGKDEIDLDMKFPRTSMFFGDMKSDVENGDTQGNKKETIERVINKGGKVWYIVLEWSRELDKNHGGITTTWWNNVLNDPLLKVPNRPKPLDTYLEKMKYSIDIKRMEIFEINKVSFPYMKIYIPSPCNGKQRAEKVAIAKKDKDRFRIFSQES